MAKAEDTAVYYQDSFGNIAPAADDVLAMGIYPPPCRAPGTGGSDAGAQAASPQPSSWNESDQPTDYSSSSVRYYVCSTVDILPFLYELGRRRAARLVP